MSFDGGELRSVSPRLRLDGLPKYVRQVGADLWQARPYDPLTGTRVNLGTHPSDSEAARAIRMWRAGRVVPRSRFVRKVNTRAGVRYYARVKVAGRWRRCGTELYRTEAACAAALVEWLNREIGAAAAGRLLAPPDESGRSKSPPILESLP